MIRARVQAALGVVLALQGAIALVGASCAGPSDGFHVRYALEHPPAPRTVSVLGILKDGLLSEEAWALVGPKVSAVLRKPACEVGYGDDLRSKNPDLFSEIENVARTNGVSEELVAKAATAAIGEAIIVFEMRGRPPGGVEQAPAPRSLLLAHGGEGAGGVIARATGPPSGEPYPFELAAVVFSARLHRPLVDVGMEYFGATREDPVAELGQKLASVLAGAACVGWNWPRASDGAPP